MTSAFLFPGQGAQHIAMGKDVAEACPAASALFDKANDIAGFDLKGICFNGSEEKLNATEISQPAIFVTSAALLEVFKTDFDPDIIPQYTAGLSLGEYTALYAAGCFSFEDGLKLVLKRGQAMQAAADQSNGSMVSIIGLDEEKVNQLCEKAGQGQPLKPANFNCPGQIVISGEKPACTRAAELAESLGAIKAVELKVAGAFHTELMAPAAEQLKKALEECNINAPDEPKVIANVNAEFYNSADEIRDGLVKQLIQPILWQKCMEKLLEKDIQDYYEIGPGRVLTGLMKRIHRKTRVNNISNLDALKKIQSKKKTAK